MNKPNTINQKVIHLLSAILIFSQFSLKVSSAEYIGRDIKLSSDNLKKEGILYSSKKGHSIVNSKRVNYTEHRFQFLNQELLRKTATLSVFTQHGTIISSTKIITDRSVNTQGKKEVFTFSVCIYDHSKTIHQLEITKPKHSGTQGLTIKIPPNKIKQKAVIHPDLTAP